MKTLAGNSSGAVINITCGREVVSTMGKLFMCGLLALCVLMMTSKAYADNFKWTKQINASTRTWYSVVSSSDGSKLIAAGSNVYETNGHLYISADYGATWTQGQTTATYDYWVAMASSSDGAKIIGVTSNGNIYISTDSATSFSRKYASMLQEWTAVATSSDGTKIAVANKYDGSASCEYGYVYTSADSGSTWTKRTGSSCQIWSSITSSSDGTKLAATVLGGCIYTSTDSGATWTKQSGAGNRDWKSIASSSDGTQLVAVVYNGSIYRSTDSGASWSTLSALTSYWVSISSSSDGTILAAASNSGYIYTSVDSGTTWTAETGAGSQTWGQLASSSDGTKLVALCSTSNNVTGYIYTGVEINYQAAAAATDSLSSQYSFFFGTKSGELQVGTTSDGVRYYIQWFTNGTGILAGTDGYLYVYANGTWNELKTPWKPELIKVTLLIDYVYLTHKSFFDSKSGTVVQGTTSDGNYYVQWFTNGTAIIAWTDGYLYYYANGVWHSLDTAWKQ
ncbi:hypothetical protein [Candidatus Magnetominusculus dajiuhuensis]|uniref:hypothetical protein n=1 Tax=Candidatus Magnetominusculus dajiuhuensis TaxID=3137712 RepID=UPI003B433A58